MTPQVFFRRLLFGALPGILVLAVLAAPALGGRRVATEPVYTSAESIEFAQRVLVDAEYLKPGTYRVGAWDEATTRALRSFQSNHFVTPDGQLDPETMGLLTGHGMQNRIARQAPVAPKPIAQAVTPAPEPVKEAPAPVKEPVKVAKQQPAPEPVIEEREMPETASAIPAIAALGALLTFRRRGAAARAPELTGPAGTHL